MPTGSRCNAAVYVRVSTDDQTKGYGPQYQREETLKAAVERDGCVVNPEHIIDDSKSGSTDKRPGWQKVLALARSGAINAIYFWKLDRMMRDEYYFYVNEKELKDLGVELRFATQDLKDPFNRAIQVAVAAEERRKIKERTYAGRIRAIRDGKWIGISPYGYRKDKTFRLKVDPREAQWVKEFFVWLVNERLTLGKIAMRARERHAPTRYDSWKKQKPRNGQYFWSKGSLKRILSSEVYTGTAWFRKYVSSDDKHSKSRQLRPESEWIKVSTPPLISQETLQLAREQLARNWANASRKTKRKYLFAKKLRCGTCDCLLTAMTRSNHRNQYKLYRGTYWTDHPCLECKYYSEADLERAMWPGLVEFFMNPEKIMPVLEKHGERHSQQKEIEMEQAEVAALADKLKRVEENLLACELEGFYTREVLAEKRIELDAQRRALNERRNKLSTMFLAEEQRVEVVDSAKALYDKLQPQLESATYETKRLAFNLFIDRVVLVRDRADVWLKIPPRMMTGQASRMLSSNGDSETAAYDGTATFLHTSSEVKRETKKSELLRSHSDVKRYANAHHWIPAFIKIDLNGRSCRGIPVRTGS